MAAFHRRGHEHSPCQYICFKCFHWECCVCCGHSQLLPQTLKDLAHVLMVRVFHVCHFWWWCSKFLWACGARTFSLISCCLVLILEHQFTGCLRDSLLSTRLRISNFWIWMLFQLLFFHRYSLDWPEIPNFVDRFLHSSDQAPLGMVSLSPSESLHSNSSSALVSTGRSTFWSDQKEKCWNGCKRTSRNSLCWTDEEDGSTRQAWNCLWSTSLRVGSWCPNFWFGSSVPRWFCRTSIQAQLSGFWTRVSSLDFVL